MKENNLNFNALAQYLDEDKLIINELYIRYV